MPISKVHASVTSEYVLKRISSTIAPNYVKSTPVYSSKMCHGLVAKAILSRGLVSDKIWLYGSGKDVWHSVLTDKNNKVVVDSSDGNARSIKFMADKGYGTPEDHFNFISLTLVEDLFEDYIKVS